MHDARAPQIHNQMRTRLYLMLCQLLFAALFGLHGRSVPLTALQGIVSAISVGPALVLVMLPGRLVTATWVVVLLCLGDLVVLLYAMQGASDFEPWMTGAFVLLVVVASYAPSVLAMACLSGLVIGSYALLLHRLNLYGTDQVFLLPALLCVTMAFTGRARSAQAEIDRLAEAETQARHRTMVDALTGLPNRAQFLEHVTRSIQCGRADREFQFALLFIDLDGFKPINDSLGHKAGDAVLRHTAKRLQACLRKGDTVGRYGGDEFILLVNRVAGEADAVRVAERVLAKFKEPIDVGKPVRVGASIGIALSTNLHEHPEDLIRDADSAMYRAKAQGKNCYAVSDQERDVPAQELKERLRRVIRSRW